MRRDCLVTVSLPHWLAKCRVARSQDISGFGVAASRFLCCRDVMHTAKPNCYHHCIYQS